MKTGILITARLGSTRLKRKHLREVNGRPILFYLIERIKNQFQAEINHSQVQLVIATSDEAENREFEVFEWSGVKVFYGSPNNIPLRHLQVAKELNFDKIISIDGDDILCSTMGMRAVFDALKKGAQYVKTSGLPFGMNSAGYETSFLEVSLESYDGDFLETGWGRIFDPKEIINIEIEFHGNDDLLRFTLDYEADFDFFKAVIEALGEGVFTASDEAIVNLVISKEMYRLNEAISNEYWKNFYENIAKENKQMSLNKTYQEKAHKYIPAGAHTYSRADDGYPLNAPPVLERGQGAYVWDMDGNKYLDFGMALRAVTVGYNFDRISDAAIKQIHMGNNLTRASKIEIDAAETLCELIPWVEMVKFAKNGSTVTTAAVKLARAYTGKEYVAKCAQHPFFTYDDWFIGDTVMASGIPDVYKSRTLNFNYNDIDSLEKLFNEYPNDIACVILEPATTEEPQDNFLHKIKDLCQKHNTVLILDEMITGFRWHIQGASKYYNIEPDLVTFGKGMANGFSVAALGGKREIMELGGLFHEKDRVFLISTTHGAEMCGLGAFVETIKAYKELDVVGKIWSAGKRLCEGMNNLATEIGIADQLQFVGVPCSPNFITKDQHGQVSLEMRTLFIQEMIKNGVLMPWVALSYSHSDELIDQALEAGRKSMEVYKEALVYGVEKYLNGRAIKPVFRKKN